MSGISAGSISTKPPSGFRDFFGSAAEARLQLVQKISQVYRSFGFEALETPALENLNVLLGSGGEENEKLIFKTLKRGEKLTEALAAKGAEDSLADLGLRFDMTVPLCRAVAEYRNELKFPWKVYHIGSVWRAERPQKGRFREFTQCDVDVIGSSHLAAEVDVLQAALVAFEKVGIEDLEVQLNHRVLIREAAKIFGFEKTEAQFAILLDKRDKLPEDKFLQEFEALAGKKPSADFLSFLKSGKLPSEKFSEDAQKALEDLKQIQTLLGSAKLNLKNIRIDHSLVRGMGYYTGPVFEIRHASQGFALAGGGRYDKLVGRFSKQDIPAVGISIGFERLLILLENELTHSRKSTIFLPVFAETDRSQILALAQELRENDFFADVYPDETKVKNQFKFASDRGFRIVLIAGEEELKSQKFKLKDLDSGKEIEVSKKDLKSQLQKLLNS